MTTISAELPDELVQAIESYIHDRPEAPNLAAVMETALQSFLTEQGYLPTPKKRLRITPAAQGSGYTDTAIEPDRILANLEWENLD
jgi:hypothetical protein